MDAEAKTVMITPPSGPPRTISYDHLIIATGSRNAGEIPWKNSPNGSEATIAQLHKVQEQVKAADSIAIGGGGPTGVETAGELGFEYREKKEITIITSAAELLHPVIPAHIATPAEKEIEKLGVKVVKNARVESTKLTPLGKTELTLSNGEKMLVDLYLPTAGVLPNSEFIPTALLNDKREVMVDPCLRVKNATSIWAAGDISDIENSQIVYALKQTSALVKNLDLVLKGKEPVEYSYGGAPIMAVTLGRSKATGRSGGMKLPSIAVWFIKGRYLGTNDLNKYAMGTKW